MATEYCPLLVAHKLSGLVAHDLSGFHRALEEVPHETDGMAAGDTTDEV